MLVSIIFLLNDVKRTLMLCYDIFDQTCVCYIIFLFKCPVPNNVGLWKGLHYLGLLHPLPELGQGVPLVHLVDRSGRSELFPHKRFHLKLPLTNFHMRMRIAYMALHSGTQLKPVLQDHILKRTLAHYWAEYSQLSFLVNRFFI